MTTAYELTDCPVCGAVDAVELASADEMRREVEALWDFHQRRLRDGTPTAYLMDRLAFSQHPPLRLARCRRCGLVFRNPVERARETEDTYGDEAPTREVMQSLHAVQRTSYAAQAERLTHHAGKTGTGIEVGSYVGAFLAAAREVGWHFAGVDVNARASAFTRSLGFAVHVGTVESLPVGARVDAVAIWNCLDQLADPGSAIRAARRLLAPQGLLALRVPNGGCYAAHRAAAVRAPGVARRWLALNNLLTFPYRSGFTPASLTRLVERHGFRVIATIGDVLVPTSDRWTRPWARVEERIVKTVGRRLARDPDRAPWFEVYARAP